MIFRRIVDMDSRTICFILRGAPVFTMAIGFIMGMALMTWGISHKQDKGDLVFVSVALFFMILLLATTILSRRMADVLASRL